MIDYFYSIKIIKSESVSDFPDFKKLKTATYDMSSIIKHEIPVKTYKVTRIIKEFIVKQFKSFSFSLIEAIVAIFPGIFGLVMGINFLITSDGDQSYSQLGLVLINFSAAYFSLFILIAHYRFKSIAWDKKVADDRGITTEEVKKCYTIIKESDWVKFNEMISEKANDEIQKFKQLFDDGVISQEEFEKKKKEILASD